MGTAVVGDGVVGTGHAQGAGCHAHRCAGRGPVVIAGQGTAHPDQAQVTQTLQGLSGLHVLAGQRARACGGEGLTVDAGDAAEAGACKRSVGVIDLAARGRQVGLVHRQRTVGVRHAVTQSTGCGGRAADDIAARIDRVLCRSGVADGAEHGRGVVAHQT